MTPVTPSQSLGQRLMPRSERPLLILAAVALVSSLMLWWSTQLSRTAFPPYIALNDNLQQAHRSIDLALLDLAGYHADAAINRQEVDRKSVV